MVNVTKSILAVHFIVLMTVVGASEKIPDHVSQIDLNSINKINRLVKLDDKIGLPQPSKIQKRQNLAKVENLEGSISNKNMEESLATMLKLKNTIAEIAGDEALLVSGKDIILEKTTNKDQSNAMFTFYNYNTQRAFEVYLKNSQVSEINEREAGYQPPVSGQEIELAKQAWLNRLGIDSYPKDIIVPRALIQSDQNGNRTIYFQNTPINDKALNSISKSNLPKITNSIKFNQNTSPLMPTTKEQLIKAIKQPGVVSFDQNIGKSIILNHEKIQ